MKDGLKLKKNDTVVWVEGQGIAIKLLRPPDANIRDFKRLRVRLLKLKFHSNDVSQIVAIASVTGVKLRLWLRNHNYDTHGGSDFRESDIYFGVLGTSIEYGITEIDFRLAGISWPRSV